jgi:formate hydrogenlyase transcriptional activator
MEPNMNSISSAAPDKQVKRYQALLRLSGLFAFGLPDELARNLAVELQPALNFDFLNVLVFRKDANEILWQTSGAGQAPFLRVPIEETGAWWVYQTQEQLVIEDWRGDNRFCGFRDALRGCDLEARSICGMPLTTANRRIGVLVVASSEPNAYGEEDRQFLSFLANGLAVAIDNVLNAEDASRARVDLERQNARLKLLLDLTSNVTSNLELRELLRAAAASIRQVMDCESVGMSLPDAESGKFRIHALDFPLGKGLFREELVVTPYGEAARKAIRTLKPVIPNPLDPGEYSPDIYQKLVAEGIKAQCLIPMVSKGRALGMLVLGRLTETSFSEDDVEFLAQMAGQIAIAVENAVAFQDISNLKDKLAQEKLYLEEEIRSELNFEQIIGKSQALKRVLELVETVAPSDSTVLLLGETGTGKELIARAIHDHSRRKSRTFVKLNCAAIPTGLLESELFGHERGAFTGAINQKVGRMELADQGTLFLDEVGDIPPEIQPKLLRVLQEREFERLGSTHTKRVNVRLVAATNRDLEKMIAAREFRSDLFYRLNVFPIRIPPLRERREDIPLLVRYFVQKYARQMQKSVDTIPAAAMKKLANWDWPGNIRELENFIERAVILTRGNSLVVPLAELDKPAAMDPQRAHPSESGEIARIVRETISELKKEEPVGVTREHEERQRQEILSALQETKGRVSGTDGAAARLGMKRTTLLSRMQKLGIYAKQFS